MENNYALKFQRFEYKYVLPKSRIEGLIPVLKSYMDFDPYSDSDYYPLHSIYFDTHNSVSFYEKIAGIEKRKKFRIRSYYKNLTPDKPVFFEIKEKDKDVILKRRFNVRYSEITDVLEGKYGNKDNSCYKEWRYHMLRYNYKPKVLIEYDRMAFNAKSSADLRITIDQNLRYAMTSGIVDFASATRPVHNMRDFGVVEIKFRTYIPSWLSRLIMKYNLHNEAYSKFTESLVMYYKIGKSEIFK